MLAKVFGEQGHPKALFILELLLNHRAPISIEELYFASYNFSHGAFNPYSITFPCANASISDFIHFIQSFPSLFIIIGNYVYLTGAFDFDFNVHLIKSKLSVFDPICPCLLPRSSDFIQKDSQAISGVDSVQRRNTVNFFQTYLASCGYYRYIPIQRLIECSSCVAPDVRRSLPNVKTVTSFLRQYPEIFHIKDGFVGLTRQKRYMRHAFPSVEREEQTNPTNDREVSTNNNLKIEVLFSSSTDFTNALSSTLPASDFSVVLVLRRILRPAGIKGLHVALVIRELIAFPYDVGKIIGLTRFELYAFLEKYRQFFDLIYPLKSDAIDYERESANSKQLNRIPTSFCIRIKADAWNMQSRLLDSQPDVSNGKHSSRLDQHIGRVFRVAKSWGIIDLGSHVHVFFDKSIFRNVNDLQKVFQTGELVYFDALRAPLRSRAQWRATRVWKPDDHDILQHVTSPTQSVDVNGPTPACLPFLVPLVPLPTATSSTSTTSAGAPSHPRRHYHKSSVRSMPIVSTKRSSSLGCGFDRMRPYRRRCCSLEWVRTADALDTTIVATTTTSSESRHRESNQIPEPILFFSDVEDDDDDEGKFSDLSGFIARHLRNASPFSPGDPNQLFQKHHGFVSLDEDALLGLDSLKRPIKLLHNTGGVLPDLEFPESDISWTPEYDSLSVASPSLRASRPLDLETNFSYPVKAMNVRATRNAGTQTLEGQA